MPCALYLTNERRNQMTNEEKVYRVVLLLALIVVACDILWWRP